MYLYPTAGTYGIDASMQLTALSACVRLISGNVAKLPLHVFRRSGDSRTRDRRHPVASLLDKPNRWQTYLEFRKMLTAHVCLHGNGYARKRFNSSPQFPDELIPYHPAKVRVVQDEPGAAPLYEFKSDKGKSETVPAEQVLHLRDLTLDGVVGLSRIEQARQGINLTAAAETYGTAYFRNGAEPGVALETEKTLSDAQRKVLIESWKEGHQGAERAHSPTVLEGGLKLKQTSVTNKDSQFLELRSFQVEEIARLYGVPAHLIGLSEKQTSWGTGVEQMAIGFLQFNLLDWLVMWETAINRDLLGNASDLFAEHLVDALLRGDFKTRMEAYQIGITNGILSRNEARQKENLPPYDGGDKFLVPLNMGDGSAPTQAEDDAPDEPVLASRNPKHAWRFAVRKARRIFGAREAS